MFRQSCILTAFAFCLLLVVSQKQACAFCFVRNALLIKNIADPPTEADLVAEVVFLKDRRKRSSNIGEEIVRVVNVIKTSDAKVREGEKIAVKFFKSTGGPICGPGGGEGIIITKIGSDINGRIVLCPYEQRNNGPIVPANITFVNECVPEKIEAAKQTKLAAENGDASAQIAMGLMYEDGQNVEQNSAEALKWYLRAEDGGNAAAQRVLGQKYWREGDRKEALKWYKRATDQGDTEAMRELGDNYRGVDNGKEAMLWYKRAAALGNADAMRSIAWQYEHGYDGISKNGAMAVKWYKLAATNGSVRASFSLGLIYEHGWAETKQDYAEAAQWYLLAAEKGDKNAQFNLGKIYQEHLCGGRSNDCAENKEKAIHWYKRAAEQGDARSQYSLGHMYKTGDGVKPSDAEAVKWFRLAAEVKRSVFASEIDYIADATTALVDMYQQGLGIDKNDAEMMKWLRRSADHGYDKAQFALGQRYQEGQGIEQNDAEAIMWFLLAAAQKNQDAQNALTDMEQQSRGLAANYEGVTQLLELAVKKGNRSAKGVLESLEKRKPSMEN